MKLFKVEAKGYSFGDYMSIYIISTHENKAIQIAKDRGIFTTNQFPLSCEEIKIDEEKIIEEIYYGD